MARVNYVDTSDVTILPEGLPLGGRTGGKAEQFRDATFEFKENAPFKSVEIADNEAFFDDNDTGPIRGQSVEDALTSGLTPGTIVQAEYRVTLSDGDDTFEVVGFATGRGHNVIGFTFDGAVPPQGVALDVVGVADGPRDGALAYSDLATGWCFTAGALVATPAGPRPIETLAAGDPVITRDRGAQPLRWIGRSTLTAGQCAARPDLAPILIRAHAFGAGCPAQDMRVSPNHRILLSGWRAATLSGHGEVLVRAQALLNDTTILRDRPERPVDYIHLMFDRHEVITADGLDSESFHPADAATDALGQAVQAEVLDLFPSLRTGDLGALAAPVRPTLSDAEATGLVEIRGAR